MPTSRSPSPPTRAADLVPLLKQAIAQSRMFYEAHQSRWVGNTLPVTELLKQPQGRLSPLLVTAAAGNRRQRYAGTRRRKHRPEHRPATTSGEQHRCRYRANLAIHPDDHQDHASRSSSHAPPLSPTQPVQPELLPLVQQQLEALATQTYVWRVRHGQGQPMQWEIVEEDGGRKPARPTRRCPVADKADT